MRPEFIVGGNEAGMKLGGDVRAADAAVWRAKEAHVRSGHVRSVAPVLAVEIAGEDEEEGVLREKARWYFANGVSVVWLVLPESREVVAMTPSGESRLGRADRLPVSELLPGLEPEVSRFLLQIDR